jgi:hypothetical protein
MSAITETRIRAIELRLDELTNNFIQTQKNQAPITNRVDETANKVEQITPYTETKTAYFNESEKTFYKVPTGNITVLFDNYNGEYTVSKVVDRVTVKFDTLKDKTNITIEVK